MLWFSHNFRKFFMLLGKVYFLWAWWTLFLFLSYKFHKFLKRQCVPHGSLRILCCCIPFPYVLGYARLIYYILGVLCKSVCGVQIFDLWSTGGELVYNALPFLSCSQFWFLLVLMVSQRSECMYGFVWFHHFGELWTFCILVLLKSRFYFFKCC